MILQEDALERADPVVETSWVQCGQQDEGIASEADGRCADVMVVCDNNGGADMLEGADSMKSLRLATRGDEDCLSGCNAGAGGRSEGLREVGAQVKENGVGREDGVP